MQALPTILTILIIGACATAFVDLWSMLRSRLFALPAPDFAMVGRWFGHMRNGRFVHASIAAAAPVRHERAIGWTLHYAIGIVFAAMLVALAGTGWLSAPTVTPALAFGAATVVAPMLIMQPGMGVGIAARRSAKPWTSRLHSVLTHLVFGIGLYAGAVVVAFIAAS